MRKLFFFLAFALVLTFATGAFAQLGIISVDNTTNEYSPTQLRAGSTHQVSIRYNLLANPDPTFWVGSNQIEVYSPDGADWNYLMVTHGPLVANLPITTSRLTKYYTSIDNGTTWQATGNGGLDTPGGTTGANSRVSYSLTTIDVMGMGGYVGGVDNDIAMIYEFQTNLSDAGLTMCIDSTRGGVAWEWAAGATGDYPVWDNGLGVFGPRCWEIYEVPNNPPEWESANQNPTVNHCDEYTFTLVANDGGDGPGPMSYSFAPGYETGFGTLVGDVYTWNPASDPMPQSGNVLVEFLANDGADNTLTTLQINFTFENNAPEITCAAGPLTVSAGTPKTQSVVFSDPDNCDAPTISVDATGIVGSVTLVGSDITFNPDPADAGLVVTTVTVTDGELSTTCDLEWNVIIGAPYQVRIEKLKDQLQGQFADVQVFLDKYDVTMGLGGFDLLIAYDASALVFQMAYEGDIYDNCGWEYFTYRYGPYGNCGSACPSGMLKVVGLAETNNGPGHPTGCGDLFVTDLTPLDEFDPIAVLANLRFLVSNDRTLECQYVPIRFYWYDCTNNILSNFDGSEAYLSQKVFDFAAYDDYYSGGEITGDGTQLFPTYQGARDDCMYDANGKVAKRNVDFQNGGVDIVCADSIDARGDINLNGLPYEIADAVMFTNYFIDGLNAFGTHADGSIAASDTNADGLALTVADLVYLVRVVIGDASPYDKTAPIAANVNYDRDIFSVDYEMGAAHIVMAGNITPTLLASNMEMKYGFDGENTNILVYSTVANQSFSGEFLQAGGSIVSTEFATFTGASVVAKVMPSSFVLEQNYPNPFNPTTTISFAIPGGGAYTLDIFNITGQLVDSFSGVEESGYGSIEWDASDRSSGIYFYRLTAGENSMTKKAVLLK